MGKTALLETADPAPVKTPDATQLRDRIADAIRAEYSGDNCSEFWRAPARRAADRIVEIVATMGPIAHKTSRL